MINKKNIIIILTVSLTCFLFLSFVTLEDSVSQPLSFTSTDSITHYNIVKWYSKNWIDGLTLPIEYWWESFDKYLTYWWYVEHNDIMVPYRFFWLTIVYWTLYSIIWEPIRYIHIFFLFISLFYLVKISLFVQDRKDTELKDNRNRCILCFLFLWIMSPYFMSVYNWNYMDILPSSTFAILFWYYFLVSNRYFKIKYLYLATFFLCRSIIARYWNIIYLWIIFIIWILFYWHRWYRVYWFTLFKHIFIWIILSFSVIFQIWYINKILFWDYLLTWQHILSKNIIEPVFPWAENNVISSNFLVKFRDLIFFGNRYYDRNTFWNNIYYKIILPSPAFFICIILGFVYLIKERRYLGISLLLTVLYIILNTWFNAWSHNSWVKYIVATSSIIRYQFLAYIIYMVVSIYFINKILKNKIISIFLLISFISFTSIRMRSYYDSRERLHRVYYNDVREKLINTIPIWSYIIATNDGKSVTDLYKQIGWRCTSNCLKYFDHWYNEIMKAIYTILLDWNKVYVFVNDNFTIKYHISLMESDWLIFVPTTDDDIYEISIDENRSNNFNNINQIYWYYIW